jgi:anthranilate phosphoribosyltransferase
MNELIERLKNGCELTATEVGHAANFLLDGTAPDEEKAHFLESLSAKGESAAEIAAFVEEFLRHAVDPGLGALDLPGPTLDVCGTGGDKLDLFNVSTTAMFVAAAAGAVVVKHGNRGITSKSGGADVLEALGVRIDLSPDEFRRCVESAGLGFMFAPNYHPAFKAVVGVRKILAARGVRTIFNLIGPLLNPAKPQCQLVGVFSRDLCPVFAEILERLGRDSAWVVNGSTADGRAVDEFSLMGSTRLCVSGRKQVRSDAEWNPRDFGMDVVDVDLLRGGSAEENAVMLRKILAGKDCGPRTEMVVLNAAAGIACAGIADSMTAGIEIAREMIRSGAAMERLDRMIKASR